MSGVNACEVFVVLHSHKYSKVSMAWWLFQNSKGNKRFLGACHVVGREMSCGHVRGAVATSAMYTVFVDKDTIVRIQFVY